MLAPGSWLRSSLQAGREFFWPSADEGLPITAAIKAQAAAPHASAVVVPIRSIGRSHVERITRHLLELDTHDRYLRFGYGASDEQIRRYVSGIDFESDEVFGIYNRKLQLIAMAHLAFSTDPQFRSCAEFGVSVLAQARGRGYGARLFDRAVMHARNEGVHIMFIHALSENTAMLNIARKAGATIERDGSESEAYLKLPPADFDSRMTEILDEHLAQANYRLKIQARQFWNFLSILQEIRQGVRDGRDRMPM